MEVIKKDVGSSRCFQLTCVSRHRKIVFTEVLLSQCKIQQNFFTADDLLFNLLCFVRMTIIMMLIILAIVAWVNNVFVHHDFHVQSTVGHFAESLAGTAKADNQQLRRCYIKGSYTR